MAVCCSVMQCVAVCCNVLLCVGVGFTLEIEHCCGSVMKCVAVCCNVGLEVRVQESGLSFGVWV